MKSEELQGYVIAQVHGLTLIGKRARYTLSPVYELKPQMRAQQGGIAVAHLVVPVWLLGLDSVDLTADSVVMECSDLGRRDRADLAQAVAVCEQMIQQKRAQEAGVVLAGADTKLPPLVSPR